MPGTRVFLCHEILLFTLIFIRLVGYSVGYWKIRNKKGLRKVPKPLILLAGVTRLELAASGLTGRRSNQTELHPLKDCRDLCKTSPFAQFLRQTQILILKILNVFLRLKFSSSLNLNKIDHFSEVSVLYGGRNRA